MTRPRRRFFDPFYWPAAFMALGVHSLALVVFVWLRNNGWDSLLQWSMWHGLDMIASNIVGLTEGLVLRMFHEPSSQLQDILYALQYGFFGGLQYFFVFGLIFGVRQRSARQHESSPPSSPETLLPSPDRGNPYSAPHAEPSELP